jgi:type IV secretion system protein TrbE
MPSYKNFRKKMYHRASATDKLSYATIVGDRDVVMNKDGSLALHFRFFGDDVQVMSDLRKAQICNRYSEGATKLWQDNILIEKNFIRSKVNDNFRTEKYPDVVSQLIDAERVLQFQDVGKIYESKVYVSYTAKDIPMISSSTKNFIYESDTEIKEKSLNELIVDFKNNVNLLISYVTYGRHNQFELLNGDSLVTFLNETITSDKQNIKYPEHQLFLDSYLSYHDMLLGFIPVINGKYVKVLAIDALPNDVIPMVMDTLNKMSIEFRFSTRFYTLSKSEAEAKLKRLQKNWSSKAIACIFHEALYKIAINPLFI